MEIDWPADKSWPTHYPQLERAPTYRISIFPCLLHLQRNFRYIAAHINLSLQRHLNQLGFLYPNQFGNNFYNLTIAVGQFAPFTIHIGKIQIAQPQNGAQHLQNAIDNRLGYLEYGKCQPQRLEAIRFRLNVNGNDFVCVVCRCAAIQIPIE